jgi:hypothetical protein
LFFAFIFGTNYYIIVTDVLQPILFYAVQQG